MGRHGVDIEDEVYILYEEGREPRKIGISDLKRMIENGDITFHDLGFVIEKTNGGK